MVGGTATYLAPSEYLRPSGATLLCLVTIILFVPIQIMKKMFALFISLSVLAREQGAGSEREKKRWRGKNMSK